MDRALTEDLGAGDPTTDAVVSPELQGRAVIVAREEGVLAGVEVAQAVWRKVDTAVRFRALLSDGSQVGPSGGDGAGGIAELDGPVAAMLKGERTALNFLQHMSGIATEASRYVAAVSGYEAQVLDTRKTVPGLRALEKYAVAAGGGSNHRMNLGDGVLIKDNHIAAMRRSDMTLAEAVVRARSAVPENVKVEVEVEDVEQVVEALDAGADIVLLDNMGMEQMVEAVKLAKGRALTEASGGIDLRNVAEVAATGVDRISVGALTHSSRALDVSLDLL